MNESEIFNLIRRIQIQSTHLAKDILAGAYLSAFKGQGLEFQEVREYQPGDDVRSIDWHVTSHMNQPYVKVYREERELPVTLLVDMSSSTRFGTQNALKSTIMAEIGATLAFSAFRNSDHVSLLLFTDQIELYLPPSKNLRHILRIIRELVAFKPVHHGTDISAALAYLGKVQVKSGICFLLSDFLAPDFAHEASLIAQKHDLIGISVTDRTEHEMPNLHLVSFKDLEDGKSKIIDTSDPGLRERFKESVLQSQESCRKLFQKIGAGFINIDVDEPYVPLIQRFFKLRSRRLQ
jgi:uncharacterized protein (DUF58 family)